MRQTYTALLRHKLRKMKMLFRVSFYKFQGMEICAEVTLGSIKCEWPKKIFIGYKSHIENDVLFNLNAPFSESISIRVGERSYVGQSCQFLCSAGITIGDDCLIATNTIFVDTGHEMDRTIKIREQPCTFDQIIVQDDVWIGAGSLILKGITIGKGSIVGAGSVVNKSIPPYQIWAGCPARFIKER